MSQIFDPVILVIDAVQQSANTTRLILSSQPYQVHAVSNRVDAILVAEAMDLDLIICDVAADNHSGLELAASLRKLPAKSDVPIMFTSDAQTPDVIRRKHQFGDAFHLKKPFESHTLLELVERAMWMPALVHSHLQHHKEHKEIAAPHFLADTTNKTQAPQQLN